MDQPASTWILCLAAITGIAGLAAGGCALSAGSGSHFQSGASLFANYCAGCHGEGGRGDGVINPYLKVAAPDLTLIALRFEGHFPQEEVFRYVDGQAGNNPTRIRHMPIWGFEFFDPEREDRASHDAAVVRVNRLVGYLESIQRTSY